MIENNEGLHRQQALYWAKIVELKVAADYIRLYRDYLGKWVTGVGTVRAISSCTSIAAWAVWKEYAFVWGLVIAISQVFDALKDVFPYSKRYKAASEHTVALDGMFIDAQFEWENVFSGKLTNEQIMNRLHKLRKLHHDAECRSFKDGIPFRNDLFRQSEGEARAFFDTAYGVHL